MITSIRQFYTDEEANPDKIKIIEEIENHPFAFGFETAFIQQNSRILKIPSMFEEPDEFMLDYVPTKSSDPIWFGDCITDTFLVSQRLTEANIPYDIIESKIKDHNKDIDVPHFQVVTREKFPRIIDHSNWYNRLHPSWFSNLELCEETIDGQPITDRIGLKGRTFNEFNLGFKYYLQTITVMPKDNGRIYRDVKLYEQFRGSILRAYALATETGTDLPFLGQTNDYGQFIRYDLNPELSKILKNTLNIIDSKLEQSGFEI